MCLAVPGEIVSITGDATLNRMGKVRFGGVLKEVSLAYVPEAQVGDYVIVHVGFALNTVDPEEAQRVFETLQAMDELAELEPSEVR
ncbi:HypC/HybG/HupF family hydrogenase formation chaperone [Trichothermofontia sichuanensis B231]|uniref:HypC/HybG/HupF family hydrogenase formation chaperone n=1 Tax=Trichothermofontia sichuanensis TaxID=3045816 RepID=UPI0022478F4F|nr:HypC/HybG/HupF family hydrogenase formation chaperone [Trichothermofontia sichuanensis]UZQ55746.1 HypC/HybG/HupF family hydrogenase formation chaperone [Trichothermofontia sichuanensis B231]